eukprot:6175179-Pleurochrysis_carterae.AAC.3
MTLQVSNLTPTRFSHLSPYGTLRANAARRTATSRHPEPELSSNPNPIFNPSPTPQPTPCAELSAQGALGAAARRAARSTHAPCCRRRDDRMRRVRQAHRHRGLQRAANGRAAARGVHACGACTHTALARSVPLAGAEHKNGMPDATSCPSQ